MATKCENDSSNNRYRSKCPAPLSLQSVQHFQPYQRPSHSLRFAPKLDCVSPLVQASSFVPIPPCPAPGTWANIFSFDDFSTKVWASDIYHQHRLQMQTALIQREILMSTPGISPYPVRVPRPSTPSSPYGVYDNLACSIMQEECDTGYFSSSDISRVTPDGDIADDVLDTRPDSPSSDMPSKGTDETPSVLPTPVSTNYIPEFTIPQIIPQMFIVKSEVNTGSDYTVPKTLQSSVPTSSSTREPLSKKKKPHQEPGQYECTTCGKVFGWKTGLVTHQRVHSGERPYKCPDCPKAFSDYSTYSKHCRIHSGQKPYSCDVCGKAFTQSGNRLRHMRTVHKVTL